MDNHNLSYLREAGRKLPRFLFRGVTHESGGEEFNELVNNATAITPHAFLENFTRPESMHNVKFMDWSAFTLAAQAHVSGMRTTSFETPFSSWSANLQTAVDFATRYDNGGGRLASPPGAIAVLDTAVFLSDAERPFRIFHMPDIGPNIPCEYLVYGCVDGPAYRVVLVTDIRAKLNCATWPSCEARPPMRHPVAIDDIIDAMRMANLFCLDGMPNLDIALAVTAAEISRQQWTSPPPQPSPNLAEERIELVWTPEDLSIVFCVLLRFGIHEIRPLLLPLANPETPARGFPQLHLMIDLLDKIQDAIQMLTGNFDQGFSEHFEQRVNHFHRSDEFITEWRANMYRHRCDSARDSDIIMQDVSIAGPTQPAPELLTPTRWEA
ncbi:hypothetical protein J7T55_007575 [Diaporthe amygdali]|uniref:uncharacterized protein n=1 Tax=Phomopsis amygdali TaxID=1214568 RepID=UPI0022FF199F|nr:uncharacterized protein J7T55_007575 [Diaporthe amygdali]KAJ0107205.1 hypothetical protein J7T55_007575 [Diaporthe amygdali]